MNTMNFGQALEAVKEGKAIQRAGWNGNGLKVKLQPREEGAKMNLPFLYIEYPENSKTTPRRPLPLAGQPDRHPRRGLDGGRVTGPKNYRKKPVVIQAMKWDGTKECAEALTKFMGHVVLQNETGKPGLENYHIGIKTLEGVMTAQVGDWIIKGVKGEFYPCKPDIFEATYEEGPL